MTSSATDTTNAQALAQSSAINSAIASIISELGEAQASITEAQPASDDLIESYEKCLMRFSELRGRGALYPYVGSGLGNGPLVELADGSVKWDMINGIGVHMFGHSDPDIIETSIRAAMSDTVMQGNLQFNQEVVKFADILLSQAKGSLNLKHCFLTNSGTLANESALKVCFQNRPESSRILAFADCFMGRSVTMSQIGDSAANRRGIPLSALVDYMPFYDPEQGDRSTEYALGRLQRYIDRYPDQHACFVMELVQGEGGFNIAPRQYFVPLMELCKENGIAVWIDEIQTFGRTNEMYHTAELDLGKYVDVLTLGKMSQVCACLFTEDFNPKPGLLSGTFVGSTVGLSVGTRILERLRDGGYYGANGKIAKLHKAFRKRAEALVKKHADWFPPIPHPTGLTSVGAGFYGGVGGMMRITPFGGDKTKIISTLHTMFREGVIAFYCGHDPYHIRFLPPVGVMEGEQFDDVFTILESSLSRTASA